MDNLENIPQIKPNEAVKQNLDSKEIENTEASREEIPVAQIHNTNEEEVLKPKKKFKKILLWFIVSFFLLHLLFVANIVLKGFKFASEMKALQTAMGQQDLNKLSSQLIRVNSSYKKLRNSYQLIRWIRYIPLFGGYVRDGEHVLAAGVYGLEILDTLSTTLSPYAELLGFSGGQATGDGDTTAERIDFLVKALPGLLPQIDEVSLKIEKIREEIAKINPRRYPVRFFGKPVRSRIELGISLTNNIINLTVNGKPLLEQTPYLLGMESERTYLVLFQNDKELRPTGGFMTAYSIMKVNKGKFEPVVSDDIYNLDDRYKPTIPASDPIIKYIKGPYTLSKNLRLRDINWQPDFQESMKIFTEEIVKIGIENIDGVIAVDTQVLVYLLDALGTIGVPGFGDFSTKIVPECNCPQVIYELESFADIEGPVVWDPAGTGKIIYAPPNYDNRKKIIGPLMNSILANTLGQPKGRLPDLFEAIFKSLNERHVIFYLLDEEAQKAVESFGIAGRIREVEGDYLHINDANLGGRKSNLYVTQEVFQEIEIDKNGDIIKTVKITYKNPEKHDGWLNSVLPNWVRIYVPQGSELISFEGVEDKPDPYQEYGKTVFAGFFELRPEGIAKVTLKYKLPFKTKDEYKFFIQKQPGTNSPLYQVSFKGKEEEFFLNLDKELKFTL